MLKSLRPIHHSAMRRLIVGEKPIDVAKSIGVTPGTISHWFRSPVFASALVEMEQAANAKIMENPERLDALKIINDASGLSAKLCVDTMKGQVDGENVDITMRIKSAWDILDRNPETAKTTKQVRANVDLTELIIEAAKKREENEPTENLREIDDPDVIDVEAEAM